MKIYYQIYQNIMSANWIELEPRTLRSKNKI